MNQMTSDALEVGLDTALSHHGTKGMKWGVWNAETRAKYLGTKIAATAKKVKTASGNLSKTAKKEISSKASEIQKTRQEKKERQREIEEQRKVLGMPKSKYDKLRETTLKSHDPRIVEKGMQTLTDEELNQKIKRLQSEEIISKMATSKEARRQAEAKARNEALSANPLVKLGSDIVKTNVNKYVSGKIDQILEVPKDKENKNDNNDKGNKDDTNNKDSKNNKDATNNKSGKDKNFSENNKSDSKSTESKEPTSNPYASASKIAGLLPEGTFKEKVKSASSEEVRAKAEAVAEEYPDIIEAKVVSSSRDSDKKRKG